MVAWNFGYRSGSSRQIGTWKQYGPDKLVSTNISAVYNNNLFIVYLYTKNKNKIIILNNKSPLIVLINTINKRLYIVLINTKNNHLYLVLKHNKHIRNKYYKFKYHTTNHIQNHPNTYMKHSQIT